MRQVAVALISLATALGLAGCGGVNRSRYVDRNEAILKSLPVFPGAVARREFSTPHYATEAQSPNGYTTTVVYRAPRGTRSAQVLRFYETQLARRGWRSGIAGVGAAGRRRMRRASIAYFARGRATVAVFAATLRAVGGRDSDRMYLVAVDHLGAQN
jgi:hypothetical protein